ncbi:MAG: SPW repeat protein [Pyrinomonadaceae bacterium MAG19_C2-C3]|nr:SPW repeat protein [Pyrinomonadaceae bacterium MAG19_C2-C3]
MWLRLINIALGVWLMAASAVLGYRGAARTNDVIVGALAASFAIIAVSEATRAARWVVFVLGLWLMVAGWVLGFEWSATLNSTVVGLLLASFAFVRGRVDARFGGGWSALWKSNENQVHGEKI